MIAIVIVVIIKSDVNAEEVAMITIINIVVTVIFFKIKSVKLCTDIGNKGLPPMYKI